MHKKIDFIETVKTDVKDMHNKWIVHNKKIEHERRLQDDKLARKFENDPRTCHCNPPEPNMFDLRFCRACKKWVFAYYLHQTGVEKMQYVKDSAKFKPRVQGNT